MQRRTLIARVVLCFAPAVACSGAAMAAVTATFDAGTGVYSAASDAADPLVVDCGFFDPANLFVTINGDGFVTGFGVDCADVERFEITGGPGANLIDLGGLDPAEYTALSETLLIGGPGDDTAVGSFADDTFTWNNGDNTDTVDLGAHGAGGDRVIVNGAPAGDVFSVLAGVGGRVLFQRSNLVPFDIDFGEVERLQVNGLDGTDDAAVGDLTGVAGLIGVRIDGGSGDDIADAVGLPAGVLPDAFTSCASFAFEGLFLCGGDGSDQLTGSAGEDGIEGGAGNDTLVGGPGDDLIAGDAGDDTSIWNNGDNSDGFDGGDGNDRQIVNGAGAGDVFEINDGAVAGRANFERTNLVPFLISMDQIEALEVNGLDGPEIVTTEGLPGIDQFLFGGEPAEFPGDTLVVVGFDGDLTTTPVVELPGAGPIAHAEFEFEPGADPAEIPTLDAAGLGALALVLSLLGLLVLRRRGRA